MTLLWSTEVEIGFWPLQVTEIAGLLLLSFSLLSTSPFSIPHFDHCDNGRQVVASRQEGLSTHRAPVREL
jgi:hypothetical protein